MAIRFVETAKTAKPLTARSAGTYVCVLPDVKSKLKLLKIGRLLGFDLQPELQELHATVMYSRGFLPSDDTVHPREEHESVITGLEFWPGHDKSGYVVATLQSTGLQALHKKWLGRGLVHSFEDYQPHVTLVKDCGMVSLEFQSLMLLHSSKIIGTRLTFRSEMIEGLKSK